MGFKADLRRLGITVKLAYAFVIGDLFHFGHLRLLQAAAASADRLICGVLTDAAVAELGEPPIASFEERKAVIESIRCVDEVVSQGNQDPTETLRSIHERYPDAELVFVYGDNWKQVPGEAYLRSIKATMHRQGFYHRLSKERIAALTISRLLSDGSTVTNFSDSFVVDGLEAFKAQPSAAVVSTKARTLQRLKPLLTKSRIEPLYIFTVDAWLRHRDAIAGDVGEAFGELAVAVRSSSVNEDSLTESKAGFFHSELGVPAGDAQALGAAVDRVVASYAAGGEVQNHKHQVLIQRQTTGARLCGVLFTRDLESNAPYHVIGYTESGRTDAITSGEDGALLKVFHGVDPTQLEDPWPAVLAAVVELEHIIPSYPLDIEFAVVDDEVVIFQVRPLAANVGKPEVDLRRVTEQLEAAKSEFEALGGDCALSDMLLWNPAELIGHRPARLAFDLFERVVMRGAWSKGLEPLGYPASTGRLLERIAYKPYINVDVACRALIPACVAESLQAPISRCVRERLRAAPDLHDKAEFHLLFSCWDFDLGPRLAGLAEQGVSNEACAELEATLATWTRERFASFQSQSVELQSRIDSLVAFNQTSLTERREELKAAGPALIEQMLDSCERDGVVPFVTAARLAFVGEALLRSLVARGIVEAEELDAVLGSFSTVATDMTESLGRLHAGELTSEAFLSRFGHLRAGTWDVRELRYDATGVLTQLTPAPTRAIRSVPAALRAKIDVALAQSPLCSDAETLLAFAGTFIAAREAFKFVFTRTLSDVLELLKDLGAARGLSPEQLSILSLESALSLGEGSAADAAALVAKAATGAERLGGLQLPPLLFEVGDLSVLRFPVSSPTFVTNDVVTGETATVLSGEPDAALDVAGRIVLIERADPGYHWLLTRGIRGLVTKYGGAASHMAICCAELGIPAAIGCGERYERLCLLPEISLDCASKRVGARVL